MGGMLEVTSLARLAGSLDAVIAPASRGWLRDAEVRGIGELLARVDVGVERSRTVLAGAAHDEPAAGDAARRLGDAKASLNAAIAGLHGGERLRRAPLMPPRWSTDAGVVPALTSARDAIRGADEVVARMPNVVAPVRHDAAEGAKLLAPIGGDMTAEERAIADRSAKPASLVYRGLQRMGLSKVLGIEVHGAEHVPKEGAFILAPVHGGKLDPVLLQFLGHDRELRTMAASELMERPGIGQLMQGVGAFTVVRGDSESAMRIAEGTLARGKGLAMYPEGLISYVNATGEARRGVALLALRTGTPIVPMGAWGTRQAFVYGESPLSRVLSKGPHSVLMYGEPIDVRGIAPTSENVAWLTEQLHQRNLELSERARQVAADHGSRLAART
jgi:1-acyl-sn-glycerol-3-phosphate acyltransferase